MVGLDRELSNATRQPDLSLSTRNPRLMQRFLIFQIGWSLPSQEQTVVNVVLIKEAQGHKPPFTEIQQMRCRRRSP